MDFFRLGLELRQHGQVCFIEWAGHRVIPIPRENLHRSQNALFISHKMLKLTPFVLLSS